MDETENNLMNRPRKPGRRRAQPVMAEDAGFESWDYQYLSLHAGHLFLTTLWVAGAYAVGGSVYLWSSHPGRALSFAMMSFAAWACLALWYFQGRRGVPALPVVVAVLAFLNSLPLLTNADTLIGVPASSISLSAETVAGFLVILAGAWWIGLQVIEARPSIWNITEGTSLAGNGLNIALPLLLFNTVFQLGNISGLNYRLLPGAAGTLLPVITAFAGAGASLGAFLGGLAIANQPFRAGALFFGAVFIANFFLSITGILLYGVCGMVFGCALGLGFGARRIPWVFLLVTGLVISFLNEGKFAMRNYYWDPESGASKIGVSDLPEFYRNWAEVSLYIFQLSRSGDAQAAALAHEATGQGITDRLDNFQNLTFIVDALESGGAKPLYGKTYTVVPELLIPRFLWPDKPRTHEGQIMLNLNFGRQATEEQTEQTYIAWGLLPEAVGNFGCMGGACFLGILAGLGCGLLETWSARKRVLSVEGLVAIALLLALAVSYEMVASVFVTATFQLLVAVVTFGLLMRWWFMSSQPRRRKRGLKDRSQEMEVGR